ncbi:MAG: hypothetical protein HZC51_07255 [Nitrospirae bacterium]|nr:hypothetical protein [Nitrospirota bacterium]
MSRKTEKGLSRLSLVVGALMMAAYIASGCASGGGTALPTGGMLADRTETANDMDEGRKYFVMACADCHRRYTPGDRSPSAWRGILANHKGRVSLTSEQSGKLTGYVLRASEYLEGRKEGK